MATPTATSAEKRAEALRKKLRYVRAGLQALGAVAPPLAARAALALFRTPPRHVPWDREAEILAAGRPLTLDAKGGSVRAWRWGEGAPVLLVHGWGSTGGRLGSLVEPLVASGRSVLAFDAPGHGAAGRRRSSLPQFMFAVEAAWRAAGGGELDGIVAHSLGGPATVLSLDRGVKARRVVLISPSSDPAGYTRRFAEIVGIGEGVRRRMESRIERLFGVRWADFDVIAAARRRTEPALVIHDAEDSEVAWSDGEALARAWSGAELVTTHGLGHIRIVHDADVIARVVESLGATRAPAIRQA
jgi:predicted alpha/beta hydrolase family esterase